MTRAQEYRLGSSSDLAEQAERDRRRLHRLVAEVAHAIGSKPDLVLAVLDDQIDQLEQDTDGNAPGPLECYPVDPDTGRRGKARGTGRRLLIPRDQHPLIRYRLARGESKRALAREYGVTTNAIDKVASEKYGLESSLESRYKWVGPRHRSR